ncbi:tetratricopeptide repeat-containing sensor histidine kinase [Flavobacterium sp. 3-218]
MKNKCLILTSIFTILFGCSQKKNDGDHDTAQKDSLSLYFSLANDINLSYKEKQLYNKKAFNIIMDQKDDSINKANLFKIANRYYNMNDWDSYKKTSYLILDRSRKSRDSVNLAKAYTYLADYYLLKSVPDSAYRNYYVAEKIYLHINDELNLAKTYSSKANLQYQEGALFESEVTIFKALSILKKLENVSNQLYDCYNTLGILYNDREEYNKSLEFHNKALEILKDKSIPAELQLEAISLNNIGYVYLGMKNYKKAKYYFHQGLIQDDLYKGNPKLYAMLLDNLAYAKFRMRESEGLPKQFYQALKIRDSLDLTSGVILNKIHLAEYFAFVKDSAKALKFSKEAVELSRSSESATSLLESLKQIALVDPKNASIYSKEYIDISEKLQKTERKMGEKFSRIEYETNEIKDQNSNLQEKNKTLVYVFSICTLLGLFFYVYKTQQAKNRELLFKQQQQIANEDIYNLMISQQNEIELTRIKEKKNVAQELHDGVLGRMFGIRISLDSLDKLDEAEAASKRKKYLNELKNVEQDIREISHDLNREKSELINNFVSILNKLFEDQRNTYSSKLITVFDPEIKWDLISNINKINLYRIVQEGLQNCNKYAKADIIKVQFEKDDDNLVLTIEDDGIGFNTSKTKNGIGLHNIEYRAKECKGTVTIKSAPGEGTILIIKIPIDPNNNLHNDI